VVAPARAVELEAGGGPQIETDDDERPTALGVGAAVGVFLLLIADLLNLSTASWIPKEAVLAVLGAAGLPLLVARAVGRGARRSAGETWAARFAVGFVIAASIATVGTLVPVGLAIGGLYDSGTGLVFLVAVAGCWALGSAATHTDRRLIESALVAGAALNAGVVVLQTFRDLGPLGLASYHGLPTGLLGNPVYTGPVMVSALAVVAVRLGRDPLRWGALAVFLGLAIGMSTERLPALLTVGLGVWRIAASRKGTVRGDSSRRHAWLFAGGTLGAIVCGSVIARAVGAGSGVVSQVASSTATETYGQRFHVWADGLRAIATHPLFGAGPGQFAAATLPHWTLADARIFGTSYLDDGHNLFVDVAVTTGLIGLAVFAGWLVSAFAGRRGPLVAVAVVLLASELVEPVNNCVTPVAMLALGAAALVPGIPARRRRAEGRNEKAPRSDYAKAFDRCVPRWVGPAAVVLALLTAVPATTFVIGDMVLMRASNEFSAAQAGAARADATTANDLLRPWPDSASLLAKISILDELQGRPGAQARIEYWARQAALKNPRDPNPWYILADYQLKAGHVADARRSAQRALADLRWNFFADNLLGDIASITQHPSVARTYWRASLLVNPNQPDIRAYLDGRCRPPAPSARPHAQCKPKAFSGKGSDGGSTRR
jgi:hypothetical protein